MLPGYLDMLVGRLPELRRARRPAPMLTNSLVAVGTTITDRPPHRSVRA